MLAVNYITTTGLIDCPLQTSMLASLRDNDTIEVRMIVPFHLMNGLKSGMNFSTLIQRSKD